MRTIAAGAILLFLPSGCVPADLLPVNQPAMRESDNVPLTGRVIVDRCNAAIRERAAQYDPVSIETSLTEPVRESAGGVRIATLFVQIDYLREGGIEPRSATIACTVAPDGQVVALKG
jgi:hypothetical protein